MTCRNIWLLMGSILLCGMPVNGYHRYSYVERGYVLPHKNRHSFDAMQHKFVHNGKRSSNLAYVFYEKKGENTIGTRCVYLSWRDKRTVKKALSYYHCTTPLTESLAQQFLAKNQKHQKAVGYVLQDFMHHNDPNLQTVGQALQKLGLDQ